MAVKVEGELVVALNNVVGGGESRLGHGEIIPELSVEGTGRHIC
jgi:hypothetical protein